MGRHSQQHGSARRAHVSLGAATLVGLACSASYALATPVATSVPAPIAVPAAPVAVATTVATPTPTSTAAKAKPRTTTSKRVTTTCDLSGPPVFGDPAHPDEITNRDCGYRDAQGRERSRDPWIDGQLLDAGR